MYTNKSDNTTDFDKLTGDRETLEMAANMEKHEQEIVKELVEAAKIHGWEEDQGSEQGAIEAKLRFELALRDLVKLIDYKW